MANRTQKGFTHNYDIVYGPVANDRVYLQFGLYESGAISMETLIRELKPISWLVEYLHSDYGFTLQECLNRIYHSKLYKKLSTESTKYWHLGPVDLYEELKREL